MATASATTAVEVERLEISAYTVPTDEPESDGTLEWDATTIVVVEVDAGGETGLGYTYGDVSVGRFIESQLASVVIGADALMPALARAAMLRAIRNAGQEGVGAMAVSAVEVALWDLSARLRELPLAALLPRVREAVPVYGSGGFTSYSDERLATQLESWVEDGIRAVKIKVGRDPVADLRRVRAARRAVGESVELMVDANGAYDRKEAIRWAERFAEHGIVWLEEPVASDDLEGLRLVRDRAPAGVAIAAGEYGWNPAYFARMLDAGAVDVLQADVTRCGGITGFLAAGALSAARGLPLSAHCAPAISTHACCAIERLAPLEHFHDHVRIERMLFDGASAPASGLLAPDGARPGLGIELRRADAARFEV